MVLGVDAAGVVVVEAGEEAKERYDLKPGDYVCGCTGLGMKEYATAQEYHLMDGCVTLRRPKNLSNAEVATIGVAFQTACLGLFEGWKLELPSINSPERQEWIVILGGGSSVGKAAVQLALASGYKVMASSSPGSAAGISTFGASYFDYKANIEDEILEIMKATSGHVDRIFDTVAEDDPIIAKELFMASKATGPKYFSTTNDWSKIRDFEGGNLQDYNRPNRKARVEGIEWSCAGL